jgi:RNA polymerase sigma-70 factor (sigma-E family)
MDGFEEWARARSATLARSAYLLTADHHHAEDLLQETLVRVAQHWPRISSRGEPDAWARTTMHRLAIDRWRRRRARPTEVAPVAEGPGQAHDPADRLALAEALARLTPRQRAVVSLRFYEDLTEARTAELLGCSVSTVKSQTRHALQRIRDLAPDVVAAFEEAR